MSMVLALLFLISTLVQREDRLQALGLGCMSKAARCSQVLWVPGVCWYAKALGGAAEQKLEYRCDCSKLGGQEEL